MVRCRKRIAMELVAKVGFCVWLAAFYNLATAQEENNINLIYNG